MCHTQCNYQDHEGECNLKGAIAPFDAACALDSSARIEDCLMLKGYPFGVSIRRRGWEIFRSKDMPEHKDHAALFEAGIKLGKALAEEERESLQRMKDAHQLDRDLQFEQMLGKMREGNPAAPPFKTTGVSEMAFKTTGVSPLAEAYAALDVFFKERGITGVDNMHISGVRTGRISSRGPEIQNIKPSLPPKEFKEQYEGSFADPSVLVMGARQFGKSTMQSEMVKAQFGIKEPVFYTSNEFDEEKNLCEECLRDQNHGVADDRDRYCIRGAAEEGVVCEVCEGGAP